MRKFELRFACGAVDGLELARLADRSGVLVRGMALDWTRATNVLIATTPENLAMGALQVLPTPPIGRLETLMLSDDLTIGEQVALVHELILHGEQSLRSAGCQVAASATAVENEKWQDWARRRGWVPHREVVVGLKRLI